MDDGFDLGHKRLLDEIVLGVAAENGAVVRRLGPELEAVPRAVPHRRVGDIRPLSVAEPGDGRQRIAAIGHAN